MDDSLVDGGCEGTINVSDSRVVAFGIWLLSRRDRFDA
jgi:hypothetical protein